MTKERISLGAKLSDQAGAKAYIRMMSTFEFSYFARKIIEKTSIKEGRLLDAATGTGFLLNGLTRLAPRLEITGLDI